MEATGKVLKFMVLIGPWWISDQIALANSLQPCEWNPTEKSGENKNAANHSFRVNCSGLGLRSVPSGLHSLIKILDLSYNNITEIKWADFQHPLCHNTQLILSHNSIEKIDDGALSRLHRLQELNLSSNSLWAVTEGMFQGLRKLKVLDLRHNQLHWIHKTAFTDLTKLEILWLQTNNLRTVPNAVNELAGLKTLSLGSNQLSQLQTTDLSHCPDLEILQLEDNHISALADDAFQNHDHLRMVDLSSNQLRTLHDTTVRLLWERGVDLRLHGNPFRCDCGSEQTSKGPLWLTDAVLCQANRSLNSMRKDSLHGEERNLRVHTTVNLNGVLGKSLTIPCGDNYNGMVKYWKTPDRWLRTQISCDSYSELRCFCNGSLTILNFSCQNSGLYYCFLQDNHERVIVPYRVLILGNCHSSLPKSRLTREVKVNSQDTVSDSHFIGAVTSSVLVTFLGGLTLGAFSRPCLTSCAQKAKSRFRRPSRKRCRTPEATNQISMETSPSGLANFVNGIPSDGDASSMTPSPPAKAPRSFRSKLKQEESEHPKGGDGSQDGSSDTAPAHGDQEIEPAGENLPPHDQAPPRPARRSRVIKLYNYDEEGQPYSHIKEPEGATESAPRPKQRTRSLNRLSAIMSSVDPPELSTSTHQPAQTDQESELGQSSDEEGSVSGRLHIQLEI
ncbi:hypothetical protein ACEWY4_027827 [Coilia grayii]|uniref:Ig-like domain-containing protein n=1 Tax=Coilia grayii TaxID=363190 RepID=A0ABD1IQT2_9TELE